MLDQTRKLATQIQNAFSRATRGQSEEQLKRPICDFIEAVGQTMQLAINTTPEIVIINGRPDIGVLSHNLLCGFIELKAPGEQINPSQMRGRNKAQWEIFKTLPNLIYTNSREWRLYQDGELLSSVIFDAEPSEKGPTSVSIVNAENLASLLTSFLTWQPIVPSSPREFAKFLAPLARLLRDNVVDSVSAKGESLTALRDEWRAFLFADFTDQEFADAYAQTVTYALLLARIEGANVLDINQCEHVLEAHNSLLGRILRILTQQDVQRDIKLGLSVLQRVLQALVPDALRLTSPDPWLYFYEDFLHAYDPTLAKNAGVYYTPAQVVQCQISLVSSLLERKFGMRYSFASEGVTVLDPAVGTGTYLVAAIQHSLKIVERLAGAQKPARAAELAKNLIGFEMLIGPYAVAHLRLSRELVSATGVNGGDPFENNPLRIYLTDTLDSPVAPHTGTLVPLSHRPLVRERESARLVKADEKVIVCIGNPPYDRQMDEGAARKGGWVRFGDQTQETPILEDFLAPARAAGEGLNLRSIYNDYVYFWRWALWKIFESRKTGDDAPGIVSFITGSSYLTGPGFIGMREYMRRCFDEIWIIDLGGGSLGARREENVFAIQSPVAIAIGVRAKNAQWNQPAKVHYRRVLGSRAEKLSQLQALTDFEDVAWQACPSGFQDRFKPDIKGTYSEWPTINQLFPWQHNGAQFVRTWPIAPTRELLTRRWRSFLAQDTMNRRVFLKESRDRTIDWTPARVAAPRSPMQSLASLSSLAESPLAIRYAYRSFDRQWALYDPRLGDYLKPVLWSAQSSEQIYLSTLLTTQIGTGPAATFCTILPDLDHFRGSFGGKSLIPLFRDSNALHPNITHNLLDILSVTLGRQIQPTEFFAYVAGILGGSSFTVMFWNQLDTPGLQIPITKSVTVFDQAATLGRKYVNLCSFSERFDDQDVKEWSSKRSRTARVLKDIPHSTESYPSEFAYDNQTSRLSVGSGILTDVSNSV